MMSNENKKLNPVTQKIIESVTSELLSSYVKGSKYFNADTLHDLRSRVTEEVNKRIGSNEIQSIDIGLNLTSLDDIPFFFRISIPQEKSEDHIVKD
jgi:hypothetical protein